MHFHLYDGSLSDMKISGKMGLAICGAIIGIISVALVAFGNPLNMGFCIACFIRDIAGGMHLHTAPIVEYIRPEIIGIILGSFLISVARKDFNPRGGSSPVLRFIIGFIVMVGALVFLGCPLRMVLRLGGGDLNALVGLLGFACGIAIGCFFLSQGFSLGRSYKATRLEGTAFPFMTILLFVVFMAAPSLFLFSESGPGSMHAPVAISLLAGLIVGIIAERTRLCMAGGIRDIILIRDFTLISGFAAIFVFTLIGNLITGNFHLGFVDQPVSHSAHLWNFLGMAAVGLGSVMLGGCPLRQLILAGEGSGDSAIAVLGMLVGAAFAHNFSLASSAGVGPGIGGKIATVVGILLLLAISSIITMRNRRADG